jgi:hypothetical protein
MVTFRAIASPIKRSDSWRIASFDIAGARGFRTINSLSPKKSVSNLFFRRQRARYGRSTRAVSELANAEALGWTADICFGLHDPPKLRGITPFSALLSRRSGLQRQIPEEKAGNACAGVMRSM